MGEAMNAFELLLNRPKGEIKTPKKLRKWPAENESPDPKKNFIKKHQIQPFFLIYL